MTPADVGGLEPTAWRSRGRTIRVSLRAADYERTSPVQTRLTRRRRPRLNSHMEIAIDRGAFIEADIEAS